MGKTFLSYSVTVIFLLLYTSCKMTVSLSGGTVDPRAKTAYVGHFINNSSLVNPALSQEFTTALKNKVQNQTSLAIVNSSGDYNIEGEIVNYSISPVAIQGNETAAMNRLTITVRVSFTNKFDEKLNFEQSFSRYADYLSTQNFSSVESTLVSTINEALTEDIFNKAFVNW
ncbi:MAG: LPS assembly lipoprotein LptE [Bacteroidales bacterium]|nr:LPS assembly lipoprotein LptE [Bacteroidales bacterium]